MLFFHLLKLDYPLASFYTTSFISPGILIPFDVLIYLLYQVTLLTFLLLLLQTFSNNTSSQKFSHYIHNRVVKHHFLECLHLWSRMKHSAFICHCFSGTPFPESVEASPHLHWADTASEGILKDLNFSKLSFYLISIQLLFKLKIGESRVESVSVGSDWMLYNAMSEGSIDNSKSQVNDWGFQFPFA